MPRQPSSKEALILQMLVAKAGAEMYGLEMVQTSRGQLARGTVYVTLDRMEEKGLVSSRQEPPGPNVRGIPRRLYKVTGLGERALRESQRKPGTAPLTPNWGSA
jgi:DNA-binding PadR family transcriptional regulator